MSGTGGDAVARSHAVSLVVNAASGWLGDLDRSAIGSLAVPFDVLVIAAALDSVRDSNDNEDIRAALILNSLGGRMTGSGRYDSEALTYLAGIEYGFWWGEHHGVAKPGFIASLNQWSVMRVWMLGKAVESPVRVPYFEAGLDDVVFIDRCIDEGIDPELAVSMVKNSTS